MQVKKMEIWAKRVYRFALCAPVVFKYVKDIWNMLKEIYNEDTLEELRKIKEESLNKE